MSKLYAKNELTFALVCIGAYIVLLSAADSISATLGVEKLVTAAVSVGLSLVFFFWMKKEGLFVKYGLCRPKGSAKAYLFYLPLLLMISVNVWGGVTLNLSAAESALYVVSMLGVGFLEEIIFRGFLFKAMCKDSVKWALAVSSVTFGFGHIVNLLNGAAFLPTLLQILYAAAAGFVFTAIFLRSGSLLPCIAAHSSLNALSAFSVEPSQAMQMVTAAVLCAVSCGYGAWMLRGKKLN